ncbi:unnamed protein product [Orchesella dallaii]|uniref:Osteoclast-stimulating factor 1 n=1 Tax=Orchesella dallaii TaxID=48710 RepID=A0ABP1S6A2_9HEXA
MAKPAPPKIAPKPGKVTVLRALYGYSAQQEDELTFSEGDILYLVDQTDANWWKARCGMKVGLIPANYVEMKMDTIENPLHDAARRGNLDFLKECLTNGVSATGLDASGNSPLHWSAKGGHLDCVQEIIRAAMKTYRNPKHFINAQNKLGDTPLHSAASKDHVPIVSLLLEHGANPTIKNKDQQRPVDICHDPKVKVSLERSVGKLSYTANDEAEDYLNDSYDEDDDDDQEETINTA